MQSHVKPVGSGVNTIMGRRVAQATSRGGGGGFAEASVAICVFCLAPSAAESNSWERENIISQDANDRLVAGAHGGSNPPSTDTWSGGNCDSPKSGKTPERGGAGGRGKQGLTDKQSRRQRVRFKMRKKARRVFEAHTAEGSVFLATPF